MINSFILAGVLIFDCESMVKAQVYIYAKAFDGFPKPGDTALIEEDLRPLKDGGKATAYLNKMKTKSNRCKIHFA